MWVMFLSGCLESLLPSQFFIFSNVTEIKYKIYFAISEDSHSFEDALVVIRNSSFDVTTS